MQKYDFGGYQAEIDRTATTDWYEKAREWDCKCGHCRNFLALAKTKKLPAPVIKTMDEFGIPLEKATYVCELYTDEEGMHYQFSYRMAGRIIETPKKDCAEVWGTERCGHEPYPYGAPDFPEPHFDLEFFAVLPWVLAESPDGSDA